MTYHNEVRDAVRHAERELVLSRPSDLLDGNAVRDAVRHAEKQLVSNILGEKKAPIPFPVSGLVTYLLSYFLAFADAVTSIVFLPVDSSLKRFFASAEFDFSRSHSFVQVFAISTSAVRGVLILL